MGMENFIFRRPILHISMVPPPGFIFFADPPPPLSFFVSVLKWDSPKSHAHGLVLCNFQSLNSQNENVQEVNNTEAHHLKESSSLTNFIFDFGQNCIAKYSNILFVEHYFSLLWLKFEWNMKN